MAAIQEECRYDKCGRMLYHPEFHHQHKKPFTVSEMEYLCKFWDIDPRRTMSFALGRPETLLSTMVNQLKKNGEFEYWKNLNVFW